MSEKPSWVVNFPRPTGTEIKFIKGQWYLYQRLSAYSKTKKRKVKVSGKIIGKITKDGLIESRHRSERKVKSVPTVSQVENREYGATQFLYKNTEIMRNRLAEIFPDCWKELYVMAFLRCKEQSMFKQMEFDYETSYLEQLLGDVPLSTGYISGLLARIGTRREQIRTYMKKDIPESGIIMFDGHRVISASKSLENAHIGYDSRCRFLPQVNLIYMFSLEKEGRLPVFYKQFSGDVPDVSAFSDILKDSEVNHNESTIIGDKGFESEFNDALLSQKSLKYVLAVRRGCSEVESIPSSLDKYKFMFVFRGRAIYCNEYEAKDGSRFFLYYDMKLANDEFVDCITRLNKKNNTNEKVRELEDRRRAKNNGKGKLTEEEYKNLAPIDVANVVQERKSTGTFILKTNDKSINCEQAYNLYKTRQDIEQAFKFYDNNLECTASYMTNVTSFEAWLFINHLALQMLYIVVNKISAHELTNKYSFDDFMRYLKHVRVNRINGEWSVTKVTKQTMKMCAALGIEIIAPEKGEGSLK